MNETENSKKPNWPVYGKCIYGNAKPVEFFEVDLQVDLTRN